MCMYIERENVDSGLVIGVELLGQKCCSARNLVASMAAPTGIAHELFFAASDAARMHGYSRFCRD